jgi:hypothetical protein
LKLLPLLLPLLCLFGYVQAIRLLSQLSARMPDIVHLLQPNFDDTAAIILRQGFAQVGCFDTESCLLPACVLLGNM